MKTTSRARGALYGLAIGDALGMPTQMLSRPQIVARWGRVPHRLRARAPAVSLSLVPAPAVAAVDTTGAGDAHAGVFLFGLAAALPPAAAASRANAAAAMVVTRPGPAVAPSRAELDEFLAPDGRVRPTP